MAYIDNANLQYKTVIPSVLKTLMLYLLLLECPTFAVKPLAFPYPEYTLSY